MSSMKSLFLLVGSLGLLSGLSLGWANQAALASDWVEDDSLNGFYNHQVNKDATPQTVQPPVRKPVYRSLEPTNSPESINQSPPAQPGPSVFDTTNNYNPDTAGLYSPLTVPPTDMQTQEPKKKGFFGKLGSFGKSVAKLPVDAVEGAGAALSSPLFWESAGALAGAGANTYMNYQLMKNNPGLYNPYYGGYGYGGMPYYGGGGYPYTGYGYGNLYGGYGGYGSPYGGYGGYGGYGYGSPYGGYGFGRPYIRGSNINGIGSFAPRTQYGNMIQNSYNNAVNNSGLSSYEKYWLRQNPNPGLFGY